jgi:hypothetical protein
MSSFVPSQQVFDKVRSFLKENFCGEKPKQGYRPLGDVDLFIEQLYNLCEASVHYQYQVKRGATKTYPPITEIFTPQWMPKEYKIGAYECLKALECIDYQIDYPKEAKEGVFFDAYMLLQKAMLSVVKIATKYNQTKSYQEAPWS